MVSVAVVEPRFTKEEVELLLASRRADNVPRGPHGLPLSVSTNPANKGKFKVQPVTDFALEALHREQESWRKNYGELVDVNAMLWPVELTD